MSPVIPPTNLPLPVTDDHLRQGYGGPPKRPAKADVRVRRLPAVLTCAALVMFAWLATRHVGEAAFLEDQVDPAFAAQLNPQYDSVLRYMMKRGMTKCRYEPASDVVIAAARDGLYPASKTIARGTFYRDLVLPPGIARYRRAP